MSRFEECTVWARLREIQYFLQHAAGTVLISDWAVDSFIMIVYENSFFFDRALDKKLSSKNLKDNHYTSIYTPVGT